MMAVRQTSERQAERRFARTVLLLVMLGFAAVMLAGMMATLAMLRGEDRAVSINHAHRVEREVDGIRLSLEQMRSARRGFLLELHVDPNANYDKASERLFGAIERVSRLTVDNPVQQDNIGRLSAMAGTLDQLFRRSMSPSSLRAAASEQERQRLASKVEALANRMLAEEQRLLAKRNAERARAVGSFYAVLAVTALCGAYAWRRWLSSVPRT